MSRCFPFPPPGYEKELNVDDANLLAKTKHKEKKEKKHKKDKKDREKKEGKEKDKDRSKEKRRDKKEKKEKFSDKNLEKNTPGDEKRIEGHVGSSLQSNHFAEASHVQELAKRIKDDDAATRSKTVERITVTTQKEADSSGTMAATNVINRSERKEMSKDKNAIKKDTSEQREKYETGAQRVAIVHSFGGMEQKKPIEKDATKVVEWKEKEKPHSSEPRGDRNKDKDEKKVNRQVELSNGNNFGSNRLQNCQPKENGFVHAAPKSQFAEKNIGTDQKRAGSMGKKNDSYFSEAKGVSNNGNGFYSKPNGQTDKGRGPKVSFVHSMEKGIKRTVDGKEKSKQEERDTIADRDWDRKQKPKVGDSITVRTEGSVRESGESNKKLFRIREVVRETEDGSKSSLSKDNKKMSALEGSAKKRMQPEVNGFLHDDEVRPSKLQIHPSSCHPPTENGRKLDGSISIIPQTAPKEKGTAIKEHKLNGFKDPWRSAVNSTMSPSHNHRFSASSNGLSDPRQSKAEKIHKTPSVKPPHPDTKYLSQILSVPKMEDGVEVELDSQDWLFNSDSLLLKKPEAGVSGSENQKQVWEKALHIEAADISALPYVIPY